MTLSSTPATLNYLRSQARELLNEFDAADGLASYYMLHHTDRRTQLYIHRGDDGEVDGCLSVCQTGIDLFRPVIALRVRGSAAVPEILCEALIPGRPYIMMLPYKLVEYVKPVLQLDNIQSNRIMRLDPLRFRAEMNALVVISEDMDGNPRAEIRRGDEVVATAGINWRSPIFSEIYVYVEEEQRLMGWGRAVVKGLLAELLKSKVTPLYAVAEVNEASYSLANSIGFVDTGAREVMANVLRID